MRRDLDLIREILAEVRDAEGPLETIELEGYSEREINYHVVLLQEAGLVQAEAYRMMDGRIHLDVIDRVTWDGHEFLEAAENEDIWGQAKTALQEKSLGATHGVLMALLQSYAEKKLGLKE